MMDSPPFKRGSGRSLSIKARGGMARGTKVSLYTMDVLGKIKAREIKASTLD